MLKIKSKINKMKETGIGKDSRNRKGVNQGLLDIIRKLE